VTSIRLKFVQAFSKHGRRYYYFRKRGCARIRLPGPPGSAEFNAAYAAALTASAPRDDIGAERNAPGTIAAVVAVYATQCAKFNHEIAAETRRTQWAILQRFRDEHGEKRVAMLKRQHVEAMLANKRPYPRRNWLKAVRPLMEFAVSIGMIAKDPTNGLKISVPLKGEGYPTWGEDEIATFRQHHVLGTRARLAFELLLNTVQRRGDVIRMGPQHIKNGFLHVRQQKTGETLALPIMPELQAALDAIPTKHLTFMTTAAGKPFTPAGFGNWFREMCDEAGLQGFSAHGLRKAGCRRLAEAGCTTSEIAAWSGHRTLGEIAHYTRAADQAAMARAAATKLRTLLSNPGGPECQTPEKGQLKQRTEG
jgi:integrase